mgnify:CR=1 FL=1
MKNWIKNWIKTKLAILFGQHFSLDKKFRKDKATASICFVGEDKIGGSIRIEMGGMIYFFEGTPEIERYKNFVGKDVVKKTLKYGGWEMDMRHPNNKLF